MQSATAGYLELCQSAVSGGSLRLKHDQLYSIVGELGSDLVATSQLAEEALDLVTEFFRLCLAAELFSGLLSICSHFVGGLAGLSACVVDSYSTGQLTSCDLLDVSQLTIADSLAGGLTSGGRGWLLCGRHIEFLAGLKEGKEIVRVILGKTKGKCGRLRDSSDLIPRDRTRPTTDRCRPTMMR